ncbi:hypothetical protein BP6252_01839 [Coleophoma cylindrospora]|uniref:Major facilitator superfamily (MFS) profile domain-containing protein n=1 Tax=Coleophoma cylindrospora TaxID=1849047 RepID=A0A3D8SD58_9HELO|nr:hypothetical protein BP6252_01839 [Coleophoma cylindrospora]
MATNDISQKEIIAHHEDTSLKDTAGASHRLAGDALLVTAQGEICRLPVPSNDPNDPLNFTRWEKAAIIVACCWFSIMSLSLSGGLGAILSTFFQLYLPQGHATEEVVRLLTFPALFIGVGNYIILPMSLAFGRRPVFILSVVILLAATIGSAVQTSYKAHLATRIIQGLATGATESLLPLMLTDITFLHERSMIFGFYWATQNIFSSCLNIASSYETSINWRLYYWVYVAAIGLGLLLVIFGAFETRFARPVSSLSGQVVYTDDYGVTRILSDDEAQGHLPELPAITTYSAAPPKKTYSQMLRPWSGTATRPGRLIIMSWIHMAESFTSPGILYAVLLSSITLGCTVGVSLTYNTVLENNYGWPAKNVGLINIGGIIGGIVGMLYGGWPADKLVIYLAKRNHGIHKPEHRLIMLVLPGFLGVGSLLLYGFTASGGSTWWGPYIGWTLFQVVFVTVLIVSTTFAAEAWPKTLGQQSSWLWAARTSSLLALHME